MPGGRPGVTLGCVSQTIMVFSSVGSRSQKGSLNEHLINAEAGVCSIYLRFAWASVHILRIQ